MGPALLTLQGLTQEEKLCMWLSITFPKDKSWALDKVGGREK